MAEVPNGVPKSTRVRRRQPLLLLLGLALLFAFGLLVSALQQPPVRSLYWVADDGRGVATLVAAPRRLRGTDSEGLVRTAVAVLAAGPLEGERLRGYASEVPAETRVLAVRLVEGDLRVDLSAELLAGGGVHSMLGRLLQLRYSLSELPGVRTVELVVEGAAAPLWGGEGLMVEPVWARPAGPLPRW